MPSDAQARPTSPRIGGLLRRGRYAEETSIGSPGSDYQADISPVWEAVRAPRARVRHQRDTDLQRGLAVADVVAALLAPLVVVLLGTGDVRLRPTVVLLAPFVMLAAKAMGLYDRDRHILRKTTLDEVPSLVYLTFVYVLGAWLAQAVLFKGVLARAEIFELLFTSFVLFAGARLIVRALVTAATPPERCIVVGSIHDAARVSDKFEASAVKAAVTGRLPLGGHRSREGTQRTDEASLVQAIDEQCVDRVIIAPDGHDQDEVLQVIRVIKAMGVKVTVLPRLLEVVGSSSTYEDVDGMTLLGVRQFGATRSSQALKRGTDLAVSGVAILALAPLLAMLAIAIKLDSPGPVFFRQRRIGRHGEMFWMLKFRSMVPEADALKDELRHRNEAEGGLFKIAGDPRITRVGRFLRRTSLDELPQLFNVLGGSMSLVGPRPLVQDEDALISGWQRRRLAVKPGMTGLWQIFGSSRIPMHEMVKIDYLYGANWSLWLDLKILLRTVPYVLRRRGM